MDAAVSSHSEAATRTKPFALANLLFVTAALVFAMVVIGVLLLGALRFIPVVGTILWSLASIFGIGVALATKFGRREPWFLEFRAANA